MRLLDLVMMEYTKRMCGATDDRKSRNLRCAAEVLCVYKNSAAHSARALPLTRVVPGLLCPRRLARLRWK
jgi:hypothetical protein